MSQTAPGERGGSGAPSHSSNGFFQQPPVRANFFPPGQGGTQYGSFFPQYPVKPTNPHMGNGYRAPHHTPMQYNMHSSHMNPQQQPQHMHHMSNMKVRCDSPATAMPHNYQQTPCGNVQYISGGNYVTTITVNPGDQNQNQVVHPIQPQQYMHNTPNYYMNSQGTALMNQMNINMNSMQNMVAQPSTMKTPHFNEEANSQKSHCIPVSSSIVPCSLDMDKVSVMSKEKKPNEINSSNQKLKNIGVSDNLTSSVNEKINNSVPISVCNQDPKNVNVVPVNVVNKNCNSNSGNINTNNRPRTNSRCDSVRSEAGESSCSSLSTESPPDQSQINNQHSFNTSLKNSQQHYFFPNNFPNNQMQSVDNFNANNGNMNYQNYMACQARMNQVAAKPGMSANPNANVLQAFQQVNTVQVQHGQVQIMQQQYQAFQNQGGQRQGVGPMPGNVFPQGNHAVMPSSVPVLGQHQPAPAMVANPSNPSETNKKITQNCMIPTAAPVIPQQNPHAPNMNPNFPQQAAMHPQSKGFGVPMQQQSNMMIAGSMANLAQGPMVKGFPPLVIVPFGWKRYVNNGEIVYVSPSGSELRSHSEVCSYLTQENTCKCGLQCPLRVENVFCFDAKMGHRPTMPDELSSGEATKLCNHRRKLALAFSRHLQKQAKKEDGRKKRKRKTACVDSLETASVQSPSSNQGGMTPNPHMAGFVGQQAVPMGSMPSHQQEVMHQPQQQTPTGQPHPSHPMYPANANQVMQNYIGQQTTQ